MRLAERGFGVLAGDALADHVDQHQVVFGAARDDPVAALHDDLRHRLCVPDDLLLVGLEAGLERLLERDRLGRDHVHERTALQAREHDALQLLDQFLRRALREHDAAARSAQRLVRGRGDDVRMRQRARVDARGHQARDVRHVDEEDRADRVRDAAHARPVDDLRVRAEAADQHLRLVLVGEALHVVVVDEAVRVDAVLHRVEQLAAEVDLRAVREVAAVREAHPEDRVARLQQREVDGLVRLRARMRLHVRVVAVEQLLDAFDRERLGDVDVLAAAVVALARIPLGILVRELGTLRLEHARARVVLGRDQLDMVLLAPPLVRDRPREFGIVAFDARVFGKHGGEPAGSGGRRILA